jgi:hypothetical protein
VFDQILVNRPLLRPEGAFRLDPPSVEILRFPDTSTPSGAPIRFGRPSAPPFSGAGYSDHFPIKVELVDP